jgi:Domain of unknown function (DUF1854).
MKTTEALLETETETKGNSEASGRELENAAKIHYLTGSNAKFRKTEGNMLSVTADGETHPAVYVHCSFPHTNRTSYLSIRNIDNKEIGMIRSLGDFDEATAKLLEEQMQIRYFCPEITKVLSMKEEFGYSYWEAETTAGVCRFTVRNGGANAKLVTAVRLVISDVNGNRFVIPDIGKLGDKEYRMVETIM